MRKIVIAIDGYSSSGKSTMAKWLARTIGYSYIDSGAMYRAVTLYAMRHGFISEADGSLDQAKLVESLPDIDIEFRRVEGYPNSRTFLCGEDVEDAIRTLEVSSHVSPVAAIPAVRHALVAKQQAFGSDKGIVMDGRDIGTAVFPDAEMKVFVEASAEERARRRFKELSEKGGESVPTYEEVYANVVSRDKIDTTRAESPLRKAADAVGLDNGTMTLEQQNKWLLDLYHKIASDD
jgi:cytidylate kinase